MNIRIGVVVTVRMCRSGCGCVVRVVMSVIDMMVVMGGTGGVGCGGCRSGVG